MALQLSFKLTETADATQAYLLDETGAESAGNTGGWGGGNAAVTDVIEVTIAGTFYPYPSSAAPITIASVELMPTASYPLPYVLWQQFILTPTLLSLPSFQDGIYILTVGFVTWVNTVTFTGATGSFALGDVITNTTTSKVAGTITSITQAGGAGSMILTSTSGNPIISPNTISNGVVTANVTGNTLVIGTYSSTIQQEFTANSDACLLNNLTNTEPYCDCGDIDALFKGFMVLQASKALCGAASNNAALDDLQYFNTNFCV